MANIHGNLNIVNGNAIIDGSLGINIGTASSPSASLHVVGEILATGQIIADSIAVSSEAWTIELIDSQIVDFYAPYELSIDSIDNILNSPTITLKDDGVTYSLTSNIASGSKITVLASTASVVTLNVTK